MSEMGKRSEAHFELTDQRLTAMAAYAGLVEGYAPRAVHLPTLMVRARDPMPRMSATEMRHSQWEGAETVRRVEGNHFTMMDEYVSQVAEIVEEWMAMTASQIGDDLIGA
jgi:thioesterase domain-containing protein